MHARAFDQWTRLTTQSRSRRRSLLSVSGAALLGAFAGPAVTQAGTRGKPCKQQCRQQGSECETTLRAFCQEVDPGGNGCLQLALPCCDPLATCDAPAAIQCFLALIPTGSLAAG